MDEFWISEDLGEERRERGTRQFKGVTFKPGAATTVVAALIPGGAHTRLFVSVCDSSASKIVRRKLYLNSVACQNSDEVHSHFP